MAYQSANPIQTPKTRPKKRRDPRIETVRLIACVLVLVCHSYLPVQVDGKAIFGRVLIASLAADGVGIFWMVTGCFLFSSTYGKTLKNAIQRILVPLLVASLVGILINLLPLPGFAPSDLQAVFHDFIHWRNGVIGMDHLWYLYVNLLVLLAFPLLKAFVKWIDQSPKTTLLFMAVTLGFFIANDLSSNQTAHFSHYLIWGAIPAAIEMIWGHILYRYRKIFKGPIVAISSFVCFVLLNLLRTIVQMQHFTANPTDTSALYWYSAWGLLASSMILIFGLSAIKIQKPSRQNLSQSTQTLVCTFASYSFLIYLIHFPILRILSSIGFTNHLQNLIPVNSGFLFTLLYTLVMALILFVLSYFLAWLIRWFWKAVKQATGKA